MLFLLRDSIPNEFQLEKEQPRIPVELRKKGSSERRKQNRNPLPIPPFRQRIRTPQRKKIFMASTGID